MANKAILVVEDDPILRRFVRDALSRKDFNVHTAENGETAVEELRKKHFHLVISDLKMQKMDGIELLGHIKRDFPSTEVIIMTAYGSVSTAVEAMKRGAFDYITKPIELDELDLVVDRVFKHQSLVDENRYLKERLDRDTITEEIIGKSQAASRVKELVKTVGPLDSTVLIYGETGTGKEVVADCLHKMSSRKGRPYIKVNCAALPDTLLESELFGHEKGAFTGAVQRVKGRFELADSGTILLDEIGELGLQVQAKLLRVLQHRQFERVGSGRSVNVDVRVLATTNRDLKEEVKRGNFRKDLFFRLNVVSIFLPPLRSRREDIPYFVEYFIDRFNKKYKKKKSVSDKAMQRLIQYDWPGNVRELENSIETAVILSKGSVLTPESFVFLEDNMELFDGDGMFDEDITLEEMEKRFILKTYRRMNFNKTQTARALGITIKTLRTKLRAYEEEGASVS